MPPTDEPTPLTQTTATPPAQTSAQPPATPLDPIDFLAQRLRAAIARAFPDAPEAREADAMITASKQASLGDYQSNAAMPLAKKLGKPPREVAAAIVKHADLAPIAEPLSPASIAGPGFINIKLRPRGLADLLAAIDTPELGLIPPASADQQVVVVDLFGVNLAKEMHVGHLRATVIGDALARLFERLGHRVIRQNHVGDWGLPIAMVCAKLDKESREGRLDLETLTLDRLTVLYREAQAECKRDLDGLNTARRFGQGPKALAELEEQVAGAETAMAAAKAVLLRLQAQEPTTMALWQRIHDITMAEGLANCRRLHCQITPRDSAGESSYADELAPMVEDLVKRGVAVEDQGALVIKLDEAGIAVPCMIRKTDGGFVYATTDIAAVRRRVQKLGADRVIYAVGAPQQLHLSQVFAASRKAGFTTTPRTGLPARLEHAAFGSVLGDDGRMYKTRSGDNVKMRDLLDEAVARAERAVEARIRDHAAEISATERREIAEAVGIAAIKYADLQNDRIKDYAFNFDRMLAFEGHTGPYLLYALVRIKNIFRKAQASLGEASVQQSLSAPFRLDQPGERALALSLVRYPAAVRAAAEALEPHRLCGYAYDLASTFSSFYDACHVLEAPDEATRASRLRLCAITQRVLADALATLGLPMVERM
jgi:arginyl-tRNA synthetase